jgi:enediyne biosynthesis protein E4
MACASQGRRAATALSRQSGPEGYRRVRMLHVLFTRMTSLIAVVVAVVGIGVAVYLLVWNPVNGRKQGDGEGAGHGFREMAEESGIDFHMDFLPNEQGAKFKVNLYDHGCGVAVGDFDDDGHDDIYFCNQLGANRLYRNKGDGTFEDVTKKAGVGLGDRVCVGATFADLRNNGRQDLFVTSTRGGNVLFRNMGDGTFKDVTKEAGLTLVAHSQTAVFFDFDNDGYLDLLVTNTAKWTLDDYDKVSRYYRGVSDLSQMAFIPVEHNVLYRNKGDGTFENVTAKSGLAGKGWGGDVAVFDSNDDGRLDVLITNMFGVSQLYHNKGDGTFTDVTKEVLGRTSWGAIGAKAFDFNNDGKIDLLLVDMHSDMWFPRDLDPRNTRQDLKKKYTKVTGPRYSQSVPFEDRLAAGFKIRYDEVLLGNTLFKKLATGKFEEVSDKANMETFWPWGIATGDFDNDGFEDVFLPSGMGFPFEYWPNALMMNNGDETFSDRAATAGIEPPPGGLYLKERIAGRLAARSSRCAAVADFTGTGRLDLVVNNFNDRAYYFRNHFPKKNHVSFRLKGTKSNRDAIGALVTIHLGKEVMVRQVHAAGGYLSQSSKTVHFGLGDRPSIDRVEIRWPSGKRQTILAPAINTRHQVTEP